ncbi:hypothetical protein [Corynebacterium sp. HS2168-gen11]|uniref:hypothetical protein n=1 Tax=Corynebacterium sp. HS2168-gen11 TaxID=2974027 RepID=UPI00216AB5E9|nr:hypothetical protein [Corynebacterium sp. HS2168-gen11]MCS4535227.1 hypothetical protein [Corynebacterium sp. HS2168-gen11]
MSDTSNSDLPSAYTSDAGLSEKNNLALVGFIFSIVGLAASLTIALSIIGVPVAIVGLVISVLGLLKAKNYDPDQARKLFGFLGVVLSSCAVAIGIFVGYLSYILYSVTSDCGTLEDQAAIEQCVSDRVDAKLQ